MNSKGKIAVDILEEIPPNTSSLSKKIKTILSVKSRIVISQDLGKIKETGMVIGVLIATMAFQAVVSPPGGVWQDDSSTHRAGAAVMAYTHPKIYKHFVRANTVAFVSSLILILLLITGLSTIHKVVTFAVAHAMFVSLASIAVSYGASVKMITPNTQTQSFGYVIGTVVAVTVTIIGSLWLWSFYLAVEMEKEKRDRSN